MANEDKKNEIVEEKQKETIDPTRKAIKRMTYVASFSALAFVLSYFAAIPYAGGQGYLNFGDVISLLSSMLFGPLEGALVGILSGVLSDVFANAAVFIPFTILAKGLMGVITGILFLAFKKKKVLRFLAPIIGSLLMVASYFFAYWLYFGLPATFNSLFDLIQAASCSILSIVLYVVFEKSKLISKIHY